MLESLLGLSALCLAYQSHAHTSLNLTTSPRYMEFVFEHLEKNIQEIPSNFIRVHFIWNFPWNLF